MSLTWILSDQPDHLVVEASGEWQIQSVLRMIEAMAARCRERGLTRALCDLRGVRGPLGSIDRYLAGARVASTMRTVKLAVLAAPDAVVTGFGAAVAANRGAQMFVTKDEDEARRWLFSA